MPTHYPPSSLANSLPQQQEAAESELDATQWFYQAAIVLATLLFFLSFWSC